MYDFDHAPQRFGTDSVKWQVKPGELPMWIADMDFATAPEIMDAMTKKIQTGAFGYEWPGTEYFQAVQNWYESYHHAAAQRDWMIFSTGVVPAISSIVRRVSHIGDNVVVQAPVYNIFYNSILNNGRHVLSSDLTYDAETLHYGIDYADLEAKLSLPTTTLMILCNPHNPVGKVWTREELQRIAQLCKDHGVVLLSDEIHGDLVLGSRDYTPVFSLPREVATNTITVVSPSKTFNVAALHAATVIVPGKRLRESVNRGLNVDEVAEPNLLAIPGTIAAYTSGRAWLEELKNRLRSNVETVRRYVAQSIPQVKVVPMEATYLMWLDCGSVTDDAEGLMESIRRNTGLYLAAGTQYGGNGTRFLRMNIACPASMLEDGLERLDRGIREYSRV